MGKAVRHKVEGVGVLRLEFSKATEGCWLQALLHMVGGVIAGCEYGY